jgi:hypothetical protein
VQRLPLPGCDRGGMRQEDQVVRPLPEEVRVLDGAGAGTEPAVS